MRLAKASAIVAIASLLLAGVIGSALRAYAQDSEEIDPNASSWSAGTAGGADASIAEESSPGAAEPAARIWGCVSANVDDKAEGAGDLTFIFVQSDRKVKNLGYYFFFWNEGNFAQGPINGSISRREVNFQGSAGDGCSVTGRGAGHAWALSGKYEFHGECAKFFEGGTFSTPPFICATTFEKTKGKWQANN
jgi:hypothetical protein